MQTLTSFGAFILRLRSNFEQFASHRLSLVIIFTLSFLPFSILLSFLLGPLLTPLSLRDGVLSMGHRLALGGTLNLSTGRQCRRRVAILCPGLRVPLVRL